MEKPNFKEFVPGQTAEFNAGFESFYIGRESADNPHKSGSSSEAEWSKGFDAAVLTSAYRNIFIVKTIKEARQRFAEVTPPALFQFPQFSLGAEDLEEFNVFAAEVRSKQIVLKYNEADFLKSKASRRETVLRSLEAATVIKNSK
ncbi:hypothetical protein [Rheinheimera hassiensis]|uniref:hypothetical protein n=1 Tax=Rheinheimera hassiensis TaxID=1193627 RepID=UPI001F06578A|nr:hypothetical protein [Rheinheimera hassiensis]